MPQNIAENDYRHAQSVKCIPKEMILFTKKFLKYECYGYCHTGNRIYILLTGTFRNIDIKICLEGAMQ